MSQLWQPACLTHTRMFGIYACSAYLGYRLTEFGSYIYIQILTCMGFSQHLSISIMNNKKHKLKVILNQ